MTDWLGIIQRAALTRFSRTGSLEPLRLVRADMRALAQQVAPELGPLPDAEESGIVRVQIRVPVPAIGAGVVVCVDEWTQIRQDGARLEW